MCNTYISFTNTNMRYPQYFIFYEFTFILVFKTAVAFKKYSYMLITIIIILAYFVSSTHGLDFFIPRSARSCSELIHPAVVGKVYLSLSSNNSRSE